MPCLESAVSTLVEQIEEKRLKDFRRGFVPDSFDYSPHHLLLRGWAPTLCRLIELRLIFTKQMMEEMREVGGSKKGSGDVYEGLPSSAFPKLRDS